MNALIKFRIDFMIAFLGSLVKNASISSVQNEKKNIFQAYFCAIHFFDKKQNEVIPSFKLNEKQKCHEKSMHS